MPKPTNQSNIGLVCQVSRHAVCRPEMINEETLSHWPWMQRAHCASHGLSVSAAPKVTLPYLVILGKKKKHGAHEKMMKPRDALGLHALILHLICS